MPHAFAYLAYHLIFSTKGRVASISDDLVEDLFAYMRGITRKLKGYTVNINGTADHVHLLVQLPATLAVSEFMRVLKANSSKWVHEHIGFASTQFSWQTGFACFSVSKSKLAIVNEYISKQKEHHKKESFQDEFLRFLKEHKIEYDEKYIWQ